MEQESTRNISSISVRSEALFRPRRTLFLLSHMRSYSSLLSHILGSHAEIDGYCEMHQSYRSAWSFLKLRTKLFFLLGPGNRGRYLFDKILHDHHVISDKFLRNRGVTTLFLVRRPDESLRSIVKLYRQQISRHYTAEKALRYYTERLKSLEHYSKVARSGLFIESSNVISASQDVLKFLGFYLGLKEPLSSNYRRFSATGKPFFGDSSKSIKSGKINQDHVCKASIDIPDPLLEQAFKAYYHCLEVLNSNCLTLDLYQENDKRQQERLVHAER